MKAEIASEARPRRKARTRILKWIALVGAILIVVVVFVVPAFVSSRWGRKIILARVNDSVDGRVDFGSLSMGWLKGVEITDFTFNDSSGQTLVKVKQISTKPRYSSILLGGLSLDETIIDKPTVEINLKKRLPERLESSAQKPSVGKKARPVALPIKRIDIVVNDGSLKLTDSKAETVELSRINFNLAINFPGKYPAGQPEKLLANLDAKGNLIFEGAEYMGFDFGPAELQVQIQKGFLTIAPFSTNVNNGKLKFAGEVNLGQKPTLLKTPGSLEMVKDVEINDETTRKVLMYLNPIFANAVNVSGVVNFNCERLAIPLAGGGKEDIEVIGTISLNKLRLEASDLLGQILSLSGAKVRGQDITIRPTRFVLRDGFLRYEDMQIDVGDNPVNFGGAIGLDKSLDMIVTLPYTTMGRTARVGKEVKGKRITLPLKGRLDKVELDLEALFEEQWRQRLEEKVLEVLEGLIK